MELEDETEMLVAEIAQFLGGEPAHINAIDDDISCVRLIEGSDDLEQRGFAGSTGTDNAYHLALVDVQVDALKYLQRAEAFGYAFDIYHFSFLFVCISRQS